LEVALNSISPARQAGATGSGGSGVRAAFGSHASVCAALDEAMPDTVALFPFS